MWGVRWGGVLPITKAEVAEVDKQLFKASEVENHPEFPIGPGCCWAILTDTTVRHCTEVWNNASGLEDWGCDPCF